jgi:hypothetical protein
MKELVPLFQTLLWMTLLVVLVLYFRAEIDHLRKVLIKRLESGSSVKVGPVEIGELRKEVASVRKELSDVNEKISNLFLTTMAPGIYYNLKKLNKGHFGHYNKSRTLERELYHLRNIGYIDVGSISNIPETGQDLSEYVHVTETGKLFVELREMVEKERSNA